MQNFQNPQALDHVVTTETSFRIDENVTDRNKMFFSSVAANKIISRIIRRLEESHDD
jgi:hypothetical protein